MNKIERLDSHQKFKELAALAQGGALNDSERLELQNHLRVCGSCREACAEYRLLATEGMSFLAAAQGATYEVEAWDDQPSRDKILARIRKAQSPRVTDFSFSRLRRALLPQSLSAPWAAALAACLLVSVGVGAFRLGRSTDAAKPTPPKISHSEQDALILEKRASEEVISSQQAQLVRLQNQLAGEAQQVTKLQDALRTAEARSVALQTANVSENGEIRRVSAERDKLVAELHDAEQSYQLVQAELTTLRAEHERTLVHTTSLESKLDELSASARDQDRRLRDDEQYLASDRDIRELMGARKLYIADVFDVDSGSRTRKPFGRVFYTESKSLIFYAFDLDRQPGVKNASAFQVWGQRDGESTAQSRATNLGILYMDSESNRRWVLRLDDPKQLAEIDAVFVTVEPQGGSQKPTGKPFLYALLRREANHP